MLKRITWHFYEIYKVGTVETPFISCYTVYSNSSIIENKMHTEAVCVCVLVLPTLWGPNVPTSMVIPVNSPYGNIFLGPHDETSL